MLGPRPEKRRQYNGFTYRGFPYRGLTYRGLPYRCLMYRGLPYHGPVGPVWPSLARGSFVGPPLPPLAARVVVLCFVAVCCVCLVCVDESCDL